MVASFMALALFILMWVLYLVKGISLDTAVLGNIIFFLLFPFFMDYVMDKEEED